jgi:hypothetical protein
MDKIALPAQARSGLGTTRQNGAFKRTRYVMTHPTSEASPVRNPGGAFLIGHPRSIIDNIG